MLFHKAASTGFCAGARCLAAKPTLSGGIFGELPEAIRTNTNLISQNSNATIMSKSVMKSAVVVNLVCLLLLSGCVSQNEVTSLDTRMSELEIRNAEAKKKNATLKSGLQSREEEEQALRRQSASMRAKVDALNEEIRALNGRIEELEHFLYRQKQLDTEGVKAKEGRLDKLAMATETNDERIYRIEQYLNFEPTATKKRSKKPTEKTVAKIIPAGRAKEELTEDEIYRTAKQAFDQGDSDAARKKFQELIKKFPTSERADNAQFWIGEIYYREKWYEKAILEYQKVIEKYPKGNKVPASLLKQGLAFLNLGDKNNSRLILKELIKKYPKSNETQIAKEKVKSLK
jgi:tol-pal system protein YbgF